MKLDLKNKIINGDSLEELKKIPRETIDLVFADPPYNLQLKSELTRPDRSKVSAVNDKWDQFENFKKYEDNSLEVFCVVSAYAKTGVEMEAIMGVNAALITIYDLSKIVNPHLEIDNVKLLIKEGGKSGLWKNPDGLPEFLKELF